MTMTDIPGPLWALDEAHRQNTLDFLNGYTEALLTYDVVDNDFDESVRLPEPPKGMDYATYHGDKIMRQSKFIMSSDILSFLDGAAGPLLREWTKMVPEWHGQPMGYQAAGYAFARARNGGLGFANDATGLGDLLTECAREYPPVELRQLQTRSIKYVEKGRTE